ncbi:hypothetical protein GN956_G3587 [Arapaima gigas]
MGPELIDMNIVLTEWIRGGWDGTARTSSSGADGPPGEIILVPALFGFNVECSPSTVTVQQVCAPRDQNINASRLA